jgi:hypothetical protein
MLAHNNNESEDGLHNGLPDAYCMINGVLHRCDVMELSSMNDVSISRVNSIIELRKSGQSQEKFMLAPVLGRFPPKWNRNHTHASSSGSSSSHNGTDQYRSKKRLRSPHNADHSHHHAHPQRDFAEDSRDHREQ